MPITIKINPVRVEQVTIEADSQAWEDILLSVWPIVRRHLAKMNEELKEVSTRFLVHQIIEGYKDQHKNARG